MNTDLFTSPVATSDIFCTASRSRSNISNLVVDKSSSFFLKSSIFHVHFFRNKALLFTDAANIIIHTRRQDCFTENYAWFYGHRCLNRLVIYDKNRLAWSSQWRSISIVVSIRSSKSIVFLCWDELFTPSSPLRSLFFVLCCEMRRATWPSVWL